MNSVSLALGRYRFAPKLWPTVAFLLLLPCLIGLGVWQLERAKEKQALVERRAATELEAPLQLTSTTRLSVDDRYRPAQVRGHYAEGQQWLLDNRVFHGQPGYHVFSPFVIEGSKQPELLVNRGWVAVGDSREFLPLLPLPHGTVELTGRLDSPASVGLVLGDVPLDSVADRVVVQNLDLAALAKAKGLSLQRFALVIDDNAAGALQYDWSPIPQMGPEKHLGYAVQWFGMAVALTIIYIGVNTRRNGKEGSNRVEA